MSRSISYASYQPTRTRPLAPAGPALPSVRDGGSTTSVSLLMLALLTFRIFFLAVKVAMIDRSVFAILRVGAVCSLAWLPSPPPGTSTFHFFLGRSLGFGGLRRDFYTHLVPHPPGNRHSAAAAPPCTIFPRKVTSGNLLEMSRFKNEIYSRPQIMGDAKKAVREGRGPQFETKRGRPG